MAVAMKPNMGSPPADRMLADWVLQRVSGLRRAILALLSAQELPSAATAGDRGLILKWAQHSGALTDSACANITASAEAKLAAKVLVMAAASQLTAAENYAGLATSGAAPDRLPLELALHTVVNVETAAQRVQVLAH